MFDDKFFESRGFAKVADRTYEKKFISQRVQVGAKHFMELEEKIKVIVFKTHKALGTNIEVYRDGKQHRAGYWHTEAEFVSEL